MKKILPFKLFENSDFGEVYNTVKEILLEIEDMGIETYPILSLSPLLIYIPSPTQYGYSGGCPFIILTEEINEVLERIKEYCYSAGCVAKISFKNELNKTIDEIPLKKKCKIEIEIDI